MLCDGTPNGNWELAGISLDTITPNFVPDNEILEAVPTTGSNDNGNTPEDEAPAAKSNDDTPKAEASTTHNNSDGKADKESPTTKEIGTQTDTRDHQVPLHFKI